MKRNVGLDVARSVAIILVLIAHYSMFAAGRFDIGPIINGVGFFGVELFFVLSGFLIGRIMIEQVLPDAKFAILYNFWKRRWMRTLPLYYLVWAGLFYFSGSWTQDSPHLLFLQHWIGDENFFGVSWSLVIEEWFYFTIPAIAILLRRVGMETRTVIIVLCIIGIILCPIGRWFFVYESWGEIRKSVFIRLDAVLYGLLLAWFYIYKETFYRRLARFAPLGIFVLTVCAWQFINIKLLETPINKTLLFSATGLSLVPILAWLERYPFDRMTALVALPISTVSYSVYLIHWDIMMFFRSHPFVTDVFSAVIAAGAGLVVTAACASVLYICWERPWMKLRDSSSRSAANQSVKEHV